MEVFESFSRRKAVAVALILGIITLLAVLGVIFSPGTLVGADKIQYDSNSEFFDGKTLVVNYVADQSTEKINAFWTKDELESETGKNIQESLSIEVKKTDTSAEYRFQDAGFRPISTIEATKHKATFEDDADEWARNNCFDISGDGHVGRGGDFVMKEGFVGNWFVYCVQKSGQLGTVGDIATPQPRFLTIWTVQAGSKEAQTCTVSNNEVGSGKRTRCTDDVLIEWSGTNSLRNAPVADDELILHDNSVGFRVIEESRYTNWRQELESSNGLLQELKDWRDGEISKTEVNDINNQADAAHREFSSSPLADGTFSGTSIDSGSMTLNTDYMLLWPQFTIYIDGADYITVEKPVGQPRIVSKTSTDVNEIGGGTVSMQVENVGDGEGSFSARVKSCSSGFEPADSVKTANVQPGDTTGFEFFVSFSSTSSTKEISGTCDLEVENSDESVVDTATVAVTGIQENECTPGNLFKTTVDGNQAIQECGSDGFPGEIVQVCGDAEEVERVNGELQCTGTTNPPIVPPDPPECEPLFEAGGLMANFKVNNPFCGKGLLEKIGATIHLILGASIAAVAGKIGYTGSRWIHGEYDIKGRFNPFKSRSLSRVKRGNPWIGLIGGLVTALIVGFIAFQISVGFQLVALVVLLVVDDRERGRKAAGFAKQKAVTGAKKAGGKAKERAWESGRK